MKIRLPFVAQAHQPDAEALSAHLDGRLDASAASALTTHVGGCEACRTRLDELRGARALLQALPDVQHPRSFRLRAVDAERLSTGARRAGAPTASAAGGFLSWMPALSGAAILVFGVVLGFDLVYRDDGGQDDRFQAASVPNAEMRNSAKTMADAPAGTLAEDDGRDSGAAGAFPAEGTPSAVGAAESFDADSETTTRATAGTPAAAQAPETNVAPPTGGETQAESGGPVTADEAAPAAPPPPADTTVAQTAPTDALPVPTAAPTPQSGNIAPDAAEQCDAECQRDLRIEQVAPSSPDDDDGNADEWFLAIEVIAGLVAVAAGAGAILWWMRSKELQR